MADRFIAVTGGGGSESTSGVSVRDVHRFDIQGNSWEKLPDLNIPRHAHASTSVDGNLYVFCGLSVTQQGEDAISSIEVLDDACSALDLISMWRVITVAPSVLAPRFYPAVALVSDDQIAIIGGLGFDEAGDLGVMGDVVVFDAVAQTAEARVRNMPGLIQICSQGNQAASVGDETVVLLGTDAELGNKRIIEYKFGSRMLREIGRA